MYLSNGTELQSGKYKIVRFINSGGFGCTYEAVHVMLEKKVAIKEFFVKDFCNRDQRTAQVTVGTQSKKGLVKKLLRKFVDEAKALSALEHPGIVRVSDVFEENGTAYFVMKYINGESLDEKIKKYGPMNEAKALRYIREVAEALKYVHAHNRLHLDIKPGNIMVDSNDHAILIDFGASKQYDEEAGENTSTLVGKTPGYAPLEQMGNDVVKFMPSTDIYALGATFYKLITGKTPLSATRIASGESLDALPGNISDATKKAIAEAMNLNKTKRPQNIAEFLNILEGNGDITEVNVIDPNPNSKYNPIPSTKSNPVSNSKSNPISSPKSNPTTSPKSNPTTISNSKPNPKSDHKSNQESKPKYKKGIGISVAVIVILIYAMCSGKSDNDIEKLDTDDNISQVESPVKTNHVKDIKITNYENCTFTYTGLVNSNNMPEGKGKGVYKDGTYEGEYKNGVRYGEGTYVTADGTNRFEGTFYNDKYNKGLLKYSDGSYYQGTFKNNSFYDGNFYNKNGKLEIVIKEGKY